MSIFRPIFLGALALPLLGGCLGDDIRSMAKPAEPAAVNLQAMQQFMLKFKDRHDERAVRASLAHLSQVVELEITYVRPLAAQAHILPFPAAATSVQVEQALRALQGLRDIDYLEIDHRVQIQIK